MIKRTTFLNSADSTNVLTILEVEIELSTLLKFDSRELCYIFDGLENPTTEDITLMLSDTDHLIYLKEHKTDYYDLTKEQYQRLLELSKDCKEEIFDLLENLKLYDLTNMFYSLTINYEESVKSYDNVPFDINNIRNKIMSLDYKVTSYNLTMTNLGRYDKKIYDSFWFHVSLIFHSGGKVITFSSPYISNDRIEVDNLDKMMLIYDEFKNSAKRLYDTIMIDGDNEKKSEDLMKVERFINQYREEELPNRNQPYHYDAEADAGFKYFLIWLKNKNKQTTHLDGNNKLTINETFNFEGSVINLRDMLNAVIEEYGEDITCKITKCKGYKNYSAAHIIITNKTPL